MNFTDWTIGKRIGSGFGIVVVLLTVLCCLSFRGVGGIVGNAEEVIDGNRLDGILAQKEVDHLTWASELNRLLTDDSVVELAVETDDHQCAFGQWLYGDGRKTAEAMVPELAPMLKAIEAPHKRLHDSAAEINDYFEPVDAELGTFLSDKKVDHLLWTHRVQDAILKGTQPEVEIDPNQCRLGKWLRAKKTTDMAAADKAFGRVLENIHPDHDRLHASAAEIAAALDSGDREAAQQIYREVSKPAAEATLKRIDQFISWHYTKLQGPIAAKEVYTDDTLPALAEVRTHLGGIREEIRRHIMTEDAMLAAAKGTRKQVIVVGASAVVLAFALALLISRNIVRILRDFGDQLGTSAEQVAAASGQVSASSQQLAEGAAQQAAGLEENASSLEEMASMTRQNASHAQEANGIMTDTNAIVSQASQEMGALSQSMDEISSASEQTQNIIKTIDEIAFQTNLLALNAAVEAARAGDAGAGFAVVADEVRSLAIRAAKAAGDTTDLIAGTADRIRSGVETLKRAGDAFEGIIASATKSGELVSEISAASGEQAHGVDQINQTMTEMDRVVQQNAASAEESASASEELSAQSDQMLNLVRALKKLIQGEARQQKGRPMGLIRRRKRQTDPASPHGERGSVGFATVVPPE